MTENEDEAQSVQSALPVLPPAPPAPSRVHGQCGPYFCSRVCRKASTAGTASASLEVVIVGMVTPSIHRRCQREKGGGAREGRRVGTQSTGGGARTGGHLEVVEAAQVVQRDHVLPLPRAPLDARQALRWRRVHMHDGAQLRCFRLGGVGKLMGVC